MFAYCGNNPTGRADSTGTNFRTAFSAISFSHDGGTLYDYVIYYYHPDSKQNLEEAAFANHSVSEAYLVSAGSFDELVHAINYTPAYINNMYVYMHGDATNLCFYSGQYFSSTDIQNSIVPIDIEGNIYLFSCQGGRGSLAATLASATNCTVIASIYKVSFGDGFARCGWEDYYKRVWFSGIYSWFSYHPNGSKERFCDYNIYTR